MLPEQDRELISTSLERGEALTIEMKNKILNSIDENCPAPLSDEDDYLCCDLGVDAPDRYKWISYDDCRSLNGRAADNGMCGH